jgi:hypothetical protein
MSKPSRAPTCIYCSKRPGKTKDHVVPECLFHTRPPEWIKAPACRSCNQEKAKFDAALRDYLIFDIVGSQHPEARALFNGKLFRALKGNHSELARIVKFRGELKRLYSRGGVYLGDYPMATFDHQPIKQALAYIARSLYWHARGQRLPDHYQMTIGRIDLLQTKQTWQEFKQSPHVFELYMGRSVFACMMKMATEDPFTTISILGFYDGVLFVVTTEAPSEADEASPTQTHEDRPDCGGWTPGSYSGLT